MCACASDINANDTLTFSKLLWSILVLQCCRPASVLQSGGCHQVAIRAILSDHSLASLNLRVKISFYLKVASRPFVSCHFKDIRCALLGSS